MLPKALSPKVYLSNLGGGVFNGNQYTKVFKLGKIAKGLGILGGFMGFGSDFYDYQNYNKHHLDPEYKGTMLKPRTFWTHTGMNALGILGGAGAGAASGIYFGTEAFYPGGWDQAMDDIDRRDQRTSRVLGNQFHSIPSGFKF